MKFLRRLLHKNSQGSPSIQAGDLPSLVWPPPQMPPEAPIMWLRGDNKGVVFLDTESSRLVPVFLTVEAARVVARALHNRFEVVSEIRAAKGLSRRQFERLLREGGELPQWSGEYRITWEDEPSFVPLLSKLGVCVLIR